MWLLRPGYKRPCELLPRFTGMFPVITTRCRVRSQVHLRQRVVRKSKPHGEVTRGTPGSRHESVDTLR